MADLVTIATDGGRKFRVARDQAQRFRDLLNDIELRMPIGPDSGGYAPRHIAGTSVPSRHATGHAVDINWKSNPEGPASGGITKYLTPQELEALEKAHGVEWGGRWKRPFKGADAMHWETPRAAAPAPLGSPSTRLPASFGLEEIPEQGLTPLSLLPAYRSPFGVPADMPDRGEAPLATPSPKPPTPESAIAVAPPPADEKRPPAKSPFTEAKAPAEDDSLARFHAASAQAMRDWSQRKRRGAMPALSILNAQLFGGAQ